MSRRAPLLIAVAVTVLCVIAVGLGGPVGRQVGSPGPPASPPSSRTAGSPPSQTASTGGHSDPADSVDLTPVTIALSVLALVVLLVCIALAVARLLPRRSAPEPTPDLPDPRPTVAAAAERAATRLRTGVPTDAIVACWAELERAAGRLGIERRPSETSAETTIRLLTELDLDSDEVAALARLYREARFSAHPMTEAHREHALAHLERLRTQLDHEAGGRG